MGAKVACSMPGCSAAADEDQQTMSEEARRSAVVKLSQSHFAQENSFVQKTTEYFEARHVEERKEGEEESPIIHIHSSQTSWENLSSEISPTSRGENRLQTTYTQGEESHHISDFEPDKCDLESEDFWDECYGLIGGKQDDSDEILIENSVEETLPEGSAAGNPDASDAIPCENSVRETLPEGSAKIFDIENSVEEALPEGSAAGNPDASDAISCEISVKESLPEGSAKIFEEDFAELNEVPDEFIGHWTLIKENHTENFEGFLIASGVPWLMRKAAIAMIGNCYDHAIIKTEEGMEYDVIKPKQPTKTFKFGKETETSFGGLFPIVIKNTISVIRENGKYKLLTTELERGNLQRHERYITEDGILIFKVECNGVYMVRRFERMDQNPL